MVQNGQPEQPAFLELSLEEMEDIIGGMTLNEWIWGEIILIKATLATGGLHIYTGPLK